eukprot:3960125-Pyramimonas_sp.AAC.1
MRKPVLGCTGCCSCRARAQRSTSPSSRGAARSWRRGGSLWASASPGCGRASRCRVTSLSAVRRGNDSSPCASATRGRPSTMRSRFEWVGWPEIHHYCRTANPGVCRRFRERRLGRRGVFGETRARRGVFGEVRMRFCERGLGRRGVFRDVRGRSARPSARPF